MLHARALQLQAPVFLGPLTRKTGAACPPLPITASLLLSSFLLIVNVINYEKPVRRGTEAMWESTDSYISLTLLGRGRKGAGQFEFRGR